MRDDIPFFVPLESSSHWDYHAENRTEGSNLSPSANNALWIFIALASVSFVVEWL